MGEKLGLLDGDLCRQNLATGPGVEDVTNIYKLMTLKHLDPFTTET